MKAVEVGRAMLAAPQHQMNEDASKVMAVLGLMEAAGEPLPDIFREMFAYKILDKRVEVHGLKVNDYLKAFIAVLCDRPGTVVLYAAALKAIQEDSAHEGETDLLKFCAAFPSGFPVESDLHKIWDAQKVHDGRAPDNWLDREEAWT